MRRTTTLMVIVLVVSTVATVPLSGAATQETDARTIDDGFAVADRTTNNSTNATTPGGQLMGVIGVQQSELNGTIAEKSFGLQVARAASNESKAAVVAEQVGDIQKRLAELRERKQQLREAHQNGSISTAKYRAEMAELAAEVRTVEQLANATGNASAGLPESLLAEKGVNVTAIQTLKNEAANLTGPEVAKIARSIAGPSIGFGVADDRRPDDPGRGQSGESGRQRGANESATGNETTTPGGDSTTTPGGSDDETTSDDDTTTTTTAGSGRDGSGNSGNSGSDQ